MEKEIARVQASARDVEQQVLAAVARGELEEADNRVKVLASLTPDSPRVRELTETLGRARRTEQMVLAAAAQGAFEQAGTHLKALERMTPESPRVPDLASRIERIRVQSQGDRMAQLIKPRTRSGCVLVLLILLFWPAAIIYWMLGSERQVLIQVNRDLTVSTTETGGPTKAEQWIIGIVAAIVFVGLVVFVLLPYLRGLTYGTLS